MLFLLLNQKHQSIKISIIKLTFSDCGQNTKKPTTITVFHYYGVYLLFLYIYE